MIVFAGFVPHPPLSIPEVGKENLKLLELSINAYKVLEQELYATKPEVLVLLGRHGEIQEQTFAINQNPKLKVNFKDFGDLLTEFEFDNDIGLGYQIKESAETKLPMTLTAGKNLDYALGVPLYHLAQNLPNIKVIPIGYSGLGTQAHLDFAHSIYRIINQSAKRVAVIACTDLSPKIQKDSPAGYSPRGQEFDQKILELIENKNLDQLNNLDKSLIEEAAGHDARKVLLLLLGIIKDLNYQPIKLSYQSPFGIGYLVENFKL
ncbi:hypothetical protein HOD19_01380 [bacterium]|jgi:MEMO1 family protein|nr:hypothetical protein [bacterium]MBT4649250.1 hypothetical protein [bacterium]